jgi:hypothetical protein
MVIVAEIVTVHYREAEEAAQQFAVAIQPQVLVALQVLVTMSAHLLAEAHFIKQWAEAEAQQLPQGRQQLTEWLAQQQQHRQTAMQIAEEAEAEGRLILQLAMVAQEFVISGGRFRRWHILQK